MNGLFDNHNHSNFSFDGSMTSVYASAATAAEKGLGGLCFSDHCDFSLPADKRQDGPTVPEVFDVKSQQEEIDRVQALIPQIKILKGIEVGMEKSTRDQIRQHLDTHKFDQIIASVHYLDDTDPWYGSYYIGKEWKQAYGHYLETIFEEMTWLKDFDIMGHLDYVVRYAPYPVTSLRYRDFGDIIDEMFKFLIYEGKALEINTKSYQDYSGRLVSLDADLLLRYREMGGEIISLGSDSHECSRVGESFNEYAARLKALGFRWTAHYEKRNLVQVPL